MSVSELYIRCLILDILKWAILSIFFIYFRLFYKHLTVNICSLKVADDWIRTRVLWYRKRPRIQLWHNYSQNHFSFLDAYASQPKLCRRGQTNNFSSSWVWENASSRFQSWTRSEDPFESFEANNWVEIISKVG